MTTQEQQLLSFLNADPLRHLVHLKYLYLYPQAVQHFYTERDGAPALLLMHHPSMTSWDAYAYAAVSAVVLPVAASEAAALILCEHIKAQFPRDQLVFKFCDDLTKSIFMREFVLRHVKTLISYTATQLSVSVDADDIVMSNELDERCVPLYLSNGYTPDELRKFFADEAKSFTIYEDAEPLATSLIYRNFGSIWEIAGVHTSERARRRGYAQRVVRAALREIFQQGWTPRYQTEHTNTASIQLATSMGLTPCLYFEHYWGVASEDPML